MANGILAGVLVFVGACWAMVLFNRLWQDSLSAEAAEVVAHLEARGWTRSIGGLRSRFSMEGEENGQRIRITWKGGVLGARCRIKADGRAWNAPVIRTPEDFAAALLPEGEGASEVTPA